MWSWFYDDVFTNIINEKKLKEFSSKKNEKKDQNTYMMAPNS